MNAANQELKAIIQEYGLTRREAAEIMMVKPSSLDRYLTPPKKGKSKNPSYRVMPGFRLKLLVDGLRGRKKVNDET